MDRVVRVIRHTARRSEKGAQEGDIWHRTVNDCALWRVVDSATERASRTRSDKSACCIGDRVEGAEECGEGREAHMDSFYGKVVVVVLVEYLFVGGLEMMRRGGGELPPPKL